MKWRAVYFIHVMFIRCRKEIARITSFLIDPAAAPDS